MAVIDAAWALLWCVKSRPVGSPLMFNVSQLGTVGHADGRAQEGHSRCHPLFVETAPIQVHQMRGLSEERL
jgi:hypothetical protein